MHSIHETVKNTKPLASIYLDQDLRDYVIEKTGKDISVNVDYTSAMIRAMRFVWDLLDEATFEFNNAPTQFDEVVTLQLTLPTPYGVKFRYFTKDTWLGVRRWAILTAIQHQEVNCNPRTFPRLGEID